MESMDNEEGKNQIRGIWAMDASTSIENIMGKENHEHRSTNKKREGSHIKN